jgi:hypothetical protein
VPIEPMQGTTTGPGDGCGVEGGGAGAGAIASSQRPLRPPAQARPLGFTATTSRCKWRTVGKRKR